MRRVEGRDAVKGRKNRSREGKREMGLAKIRKT